MCDFLVVLASKLVNRQKLFICIKSKMLIFVIGKIIGIGAIAHDKQLHETHQRIAISVSGLIFIIHNLLYGFTWRNVQFLQLNLNYWQTINQQNNIVTLIAVFSINS